MRHGKKPTRAQKIQIRKAGLEPGDWLVIGASPTILQLVHRYAGVVRKIYIE